MKIFNKSLVLITAIGAITFSQKSNAQTPGVWTGSTTQTLTSDAVGIGTTAPISHLEVEYCNDQEKGLVVTKKDCGVYGVAPGSMVFSYDGVFSPVLPAEGGGGGVPVTFINPISYLLTQNVSIATQPMIWARTENDPSHPSSPSASASHTTQFIVTPFGKAGINIENPRATLDVKGLGGWNVPTAIFGRQNQGSPDRTQHIHYVPLLAENGYNQIVNTNDQGIFFTDGMGAEGSNVNGSFIIAPWAENGDPLVGGLKIDRDGSLEVHGKTRTTEVNVNVQWWSDFVFSDNYKLMPLGEVKKFIKENKHLPNIPSEEELCKSGLNLGEMQALHMQKIEELTLYVIEQEKRTEEQKQLALKQNEEINSLKKQVKALEEKLNQLLANKNK